MKRSITEFLTFVLPEKWEIQRRFYHISRCFVSRNFFASRKWRYQENFPRLILRKVFGGHDHSEGSTVAGTNIHIRRSQKEEKSNYVRILSARCEVCHLRKKVVVRQKNPTAENCHVLRSTFNLCIWCVFSMSSKVSMISPCNKI